MTGKNRTLQLSGAYALAIGAVVFLVPIEARADCAATAIGLPANTVNITCTPTPAAPVTSFATSYIGSDGSGNDTLTMTGGQIDDIVGVGTPFVDISFPLDASPTVIQMLAGNDVVTISGGTIGTAVDTIGLSLGDGDDQFAMSGGTINGTVFGDAGNDLIEVSGTAVITGVPDISAAIETGTGSAQVRILGGTVGNDPTQTAVFLEDGANLFQMSGGQVIGSVVGQGGGNTYSVSGGLIQGSLFAGSGNDSVTISGSAQILPTSTASDAVGLDTGNDTFIMTGGTLGSSVSGNDGNDSLSVSGGSIATYLAGNGGADQISVSGGSIATDVSGDDASNVGGGADQISVSGGSIGGSVLGGIGNDALSVSGGTVAANVSGDDGADLISVSGGAVGGSVLGGTGDDAISVSGGTIAGSVSGDAGNDAVSVSGGTIAGGVAAETVTLTGGTIGGDITGISGNTLIIDDSLSPAALNLRNGVVFSGTNAVGFITNTDLAVGGAFTQVFTGFDSVTADASTLGFGTSAIGIGLLTLQNGSTLFINGSANMTGTASVVGSTIQMIDGVADDRFTLGGLTLNNAQIGLDIDQQTLQADQIVTGAFSAAGVNTIAVNLLGTPQFAQATDIPIILTDGPVVGTFVISGVPGTPGALFTYEVVAGPGGTLYIRATPANFGIALAPQNAIDVSIIETALDALHGITNDAIAADLGLANGAQAIAITPTLSVFASGQLAHTEHDGFEISTGGVTGDGPGFGADEFSAAISLDFNAAKAFDLDKQYGLNFGLFGGYASVDVDMNDFNGFSVVGNGNNRSGMFGGYTLYRQGYTYALVSGSAFIGNSEVFNGILGTNGSYDTQGYALTGSVGHIFALSDRMRFDLRGGMLGVIFSGDDYTDDGGNQYGGSQISFGAVKFEPGIYGDFTLENGMVISPYARADIQQRFGYSNKASIDTAEVEFDDADFSAALSSGFNLKLSERSTLSSEIRGKWSTDSTTLSGKLGLKVAF